MLTSKAWNIICYSLKSIYATGKQNLHVIRWSELRTILNFFDKQGVNNCFLQSVAAIFED